MNERRLLRLLAYGQMILMLALLFMPLLLRHLSDTIGQIAFVGLTVLFGLWSYRLLAALQDLPK